MDICAALLQRKASRNCDQGQIETVNDSSCERRPFIWLASPVKPEVKLLFLLFSSNRASLDMCTLWACAGSGHVQALGMCRLCLCR